MDLIVDVDGTLADCGHRLPWVRSRPPNWSAFLKPEAVLQDRPILPVIQMVNDSSFHFRKTIITSARNERHREVTTEWLRKNKVKFDAVYLRPDEDYRPDTEVKREMLVKIRADGYNPVAAVDDRLGVCKMWHEEGLFVFCVNQGLKEF